MDKKKKGVWKIIAIILSIVLIFIILTNVPSSSRNETIYISGVNEESRINYMDKPIEISISGVNNQIIVSPTTIVIEIDMSGTGNIIYLCENIHFPIVDKSGTNNRIEYNQC